MLANMYVPDRLITWSCRECFRILMVLEQNGEMIIFLIVTLTSSCKTNPEIVSHNQIMSIERSYCT